MDIKNNIKDWTEKGVITPEQAQTMLRDLENQKKEEGSNKFITAVSIIGSLLLGIGIILFLTMNWDSIPDLFKICLLTVFTFGIYYLGYLLRYEKQNYPKVGSSLIFLGAILFGASVFLVAQIYNINVGLKNNYWLTGLWLLGILPLVYGFKSKPIAVLSAFLFFLALGFLAANYIEQIGLFKSILLYFVASLFILAVGLMHDFFQKFLEIGSIYKISGLKVGLFSIFLMTFKFVYEEFDFLNKNTNGGNIALAILGIVSMIFLLGSLYLNREKKESKLIGIFGISFLMFSFIALATFSESTHLFFLFFYNIVFFILIIAMFYFGYNEEKIRVVNLASFWLSLFLVCKYFQWFWDIFNPYIFFIVGGLIMIFGGVFLEKRRREIKIKLNLENK